MEFCRSDVEDVCNVTRTLQRFGEASRLFMNAAKSVVYLGGVDDVHTQHIYSDRWHGGKIVPYEIFGCSLASEDSPHSKLSTTVAKVTEKIK